MAKTKTTSSDETASEPNQKNIIKALKKRERIQKAIAKKQGELAKINEQIAQYGDWMKNLVQS
jgi:hypothetical protein